MLRSRFGKRVSLVATALLLAACSDSAVAPSGNELVGDAVFARKPSSSPGNPGDNNSCAVDGGTKARKSPNDKNQCGGGSSFFNGYSAFSTPPTFWNKTDACGRAYYKTQCEAAFDAADSGAENSVRVLFLGAFWDSTGFGDPTRYLIGAPKPPRAELFPAFDHSRFSDVSWYGSTGTLRKAAIPGYFDLSIDLWTLFIDDDFDLSITSLVPTCGDVIPYLFTATPTTDYLRVTFDGKQYNLAIFDPSPC